MYVYYERMIGYAELCSFCFLEPNDSGACYSITYT